MADVAAEVSTIRTSIYGREMRKSIADGIEKIANGAGAGGTPGAGSGGTTIVEGSGGLTEIDIEAYGIDNTGDVSKATANSMAMQRAIDDAYRAGTHDVYLGAGTYYLDTTYRHTYPLYNLKNDDDIYCCPDDYTNTNGYLIYRGGIRLPSNFNFHMSADTILKAAPVDALDLYNRYYLYKEHNVPFDDSLYAYSAEGFTVILMFNVDNTGVYGGVIFGERNGHIFHRPTTADPENFADYGVASEGENTACIACRHPSSNITIKGINMRESIGDSFQLRDGVVKFAEQSRFITVENCTLYGNRRSGIAGDGRHWRIENCRFECIGPEMYGWPGTSVSNGIRAEPTAPKWFADVNVNNCYFDDITNDAIETHAYRVANWKITNCTVGSNCKRGFFLRFGLGAIVTNCRFYCKIGVETGVYLYASAPPGLEHISENNWPSTTVLPDIRYGTFEDDKAISRIIIANNYFCRSTLASRGINVSIENNYFEDPVTNIEIYSTSNAPSALANKYRFASMAANTIFSGNIIIRNDFIRNADGNVQGGIAATGPNVIISNNFLSYFSIAVGLNSPKYGSGSYESNTYEGVVVKSNFIYGGRISADNMCDISNNTLISSTEKLITSGKEGYQTAISVGYGDTSHTTAAVSIVNNVISNYYGGIAVMNIPGVSISGNTIRNQFDTSDTDYAINVNRPGVANQPGFADVTNNSISGYNRIFNGNMEVDDAKYIIFANNTCYLTNNHSKGEYPVLLQHSTAGDGSLGAARIINNYFYIKNPKKDIPFIRIYRLNDVKILNNVIENGTQQKPVSVNPSGIFASNIVVKGNQFTTTPVDNSVVHLVNKDEVTLHESNNITI